MMPRELVMYTMVITDCGQVDALLQQYDPAERTQVHINDIPSRSWRDPLLIASVPSAVYDNAVIVVYLMTADALEAMRDFAATLRTQLRLRLLPVPVLTYRHIRGQQRLDPCIQEVG